MSESKLVPKGLYGVAVAETGIAKSGGDGSLVYRGYSIADLFENSTFEESAYLILYGKLPSKRELLSFSGLLKEHAKVPKEIYEVVRNLRRESHPMDVLRTAVSALGANEQPRLSATDQQISLISKMPTLAANCYRITSGNDKTVEPDPSMNTAENFLYMVTGVRPGKFEAWAFERELIAYLEHDLNASSFAVRVIASTLADIYAAVTGGIAALKGPLHGGANEAAMRLLLNIGQAKDAGAKIQHMLSNGEKIMGFGHRVYKISDPRAQLGKQLLKRLLSEKKEDQNLYELCDAIEKKVWELKKLPANLDFYAAPIFYELGIPIDVYTPIFAASRIVGWVTHYNEQMKDNKIFRPDAIYTGPHKLAYVNIESRS